MEENKKIILKDGTKIDIKEFETKDPDIRVVLLDMNYQEAIDTLTADQVSDVKILNELGETVLTAKNHVLGDNISVNSKEGTVEVILTVKETREAVVDAIKAIQTLQNTSKQNTADIDAINEAIASLAEIVGGTTE